MSEQHAEEPRVVFRNHDNVRVGGQFAVVNGTVRIQADGGSWDQPAARDDEPADGGQAGEGLVSGPIPHPSRLSPTPETKGRNG
jgi:hypothetical protein